SGPSSFLFSNQSSHNLQLSYQIDAGSSQTAVVNAGQSQTISNVPHCSCFTVNNITPTQEGFSVELCSSGEADIKNDPLNPFGGLTTTLSGGGPSSGVVTFTIQNLSTHALTIFPYVNGQVRSSFNFLPAASQSITVDRCQRLRVLARDPGNSFPDVVFVESPATTQAVYFYRDLGTQVQVLKQAS